MAGKERRRLTDAAIARLRAREREYTVWDSAVPGLGVRVRPAGGKSYVLLRQPPTGSRRVSLGAVSTRGIDEVRRECHARRACPEPGQPGKPEENVPLFRDFVEGPWKEAHFDRYKPSTRKCTRIFLTRQLLPAFGSKPLDRIAPAHVRRWFDSYSRTAPGGANRTLDILQQIMNYAIARGHIETNPTRGVKRNRRTPLTRFLSRDEIGRLHGALDEHAERGEESRKQADIVRLLLLTGCRKGEIVGLRWSEVRADALELADSKTGPRRVPLNSPARRILERQPRGQSPFVFPSGGLAHARAFQRAHDAALRPSREPRGRGCGRKGRASNRGSHRSAKRLSRHRQPHIRSRQIGALAYAARWVSFDKNAFSMSRQSPQAPSFGRDQQARGPVRDIHSREFCPLVDGTRHPTIRRAKASITKATWTNPAQVAT